MNQKLIVILLVASIAGVWGFFLFSGIQETPVNSGAPVRRTVLERISLPNPELDGQMSLEKCLSQRKTVRNLSSGRLILKEIAQLAWAGQGVTRKDFYRTAPSAGGLYPLDIRFMVGNVQGLGPGVYRYVPAGHYLEKESQGDNRREIANLAHGQDFLASGSLLMVISGVVSRSSGKYGERASRYILMEAGHVAQNIQLQAVARGLETGLVGAFRDERIRRALNMFEDEIPVYLLPIGRQIGSGAVDVGPDPTAFGSGTFEPGVE